MYKTTVRKLSKQQSKQIRLSNFLGPQNYIKNFNYTLKYSTVFNLVFWIILFTLNSSLNVLLCQLTT